MTNGTKAVKQQILVHSGISDSNKRKLASIKEYVNEYFAELITTENKYVLDLFLMALMKSDGGRGPIDGDYKSIVDCARAALMHSIVLDDVAHSLILRNGKAAIIESLKKTTSRISATLGITIFPSIFSKSQLLFLQDSKMKLPDSPADIPIGDYTTATSIFDAGLVVIKAIKENQTLHREVYSVTNLLSTARKEIKGDKVESYIMRRGQKSYSSANSNWYIGSDSLEMLKKTAVRQFIKYFSL